MPSLIKLKPTKRRTWANGTYASAARSRFFNSVQCLYWFLFDSTSHAPWYISILPIGFSNTSVRTFKWISWVWKNLQCMEVSTWKENSIHTNTDSFCLYIKNNPCSSLLFEDKFEEYYCREERLQNGLFTKIKIGWISFSDRIDIADFDNSFIRAGWLHWWERLVLVTNKWIFEDFLC